MFGVRLPAGCDVDPPGGGIAGCIEAPTGMRWATIRAHCVAQAERYDIVSVRDVVAYFDDGSEAYLRYDDGAKKWSFAGDDGIYAAGYARAAGYPE